MMGDIFRNTKSAIAWLGPARDDSDIAMDLMVDNRKVERLVTGREKQHEINVGTCLEAEAIYKLCHRSYWKRVWIIQEIHLARDYVVWCGTKTIPRNRFKSSLVATLRASQSWTWRGNGLEE